MVGIWIFKNIIWQNMWIMQDDFQYDLNVTNVKFVMSPAQPSATPPLSFPSWDCRSRLKSFWMTSPTTIQPNQPKSKQPKGKKYQTKNTKNNTISFLERLHLQNMWIMQDDFQYDLNVTNVKFVMSPAQPSATPPLSFPSWDCRSRLKSFWMTSPTTIQPNQPKSKQPMPTSQKPKKEKKNIKQKKPKTMQFHFLKDQKVKCIGSWVRKQVFFRRLTENQY